MSSGSAGLDEPAAPAPAPAANDAVRAQEHLQNILGFKMRIYQTEAAKAEAEAAAKAEAEAAAAAKASEPTEPAEPAKPAEPPSSGEDFKKLLSMLATPSETAKDGGGGSSSSHSACGSAALQALRQGWDPFAELPKPLDVLEHDKNERLKKKPKKRGPEFSHLAMAADEGLAPVSPASLVVSSLPVRLGRNDVFDKREKKGRVLDKTQVSIVVGHNDVHNHELAEKMRRSQEFADRDKRTSIFVKCMRQWSA